MNELTDKQIVKLAKVIEGWMLEDLDFLWRVAVEQAERWTEEEYLEQFPEEEAHE